MPSVRARAEAGRARRAGIPRTRARRCLRAAATTAREQRAPDRRRPRPRPRDRGRASRRVVVEAAALADLPVHAGGLRRRRRACGRCRGCACARRRVLGEHEPEGHEPPAVLGPELEVGQRREIGAEIAAPAPGRAPITLRAHREHAAGAAAQLQQVGERARRHGVEDLLQLGADRGRRAAERPLDAPARGEHVDREREARAAHLLEEQRRPLGAWPRGTRSR